MDDGDAMADPAAQTYGDGCASVPADGDGSFNGMATAPVASAASANPLLKTLVAAVTAADLVEPLNSAPALTVFAPGRPGLRRDPEGGPRRAAQGQEDADHGALAPRGGRADHARPALR